MGQTRWLARGSKHAGPAPRAVDHDRAADRAGGRFDAGHPTVVDDQPGDHAILEQIATGAANGPAKSPGQASVIDQNVIGIIDRGQDVRGEARLGNSRVGSVEPPGPDAGWLLK